MDAGVEEGDLVGAVGDGAGMADELVQPLVAHRSMALVVNIGPVRRTWRMPFEEHAESHGGAQHCRAHDQVKFAGVEAVRDLPAGLVQRGGLFLQRPVSGQGPVIDSQLRRDLIGVMLGLVGPQAVVSGQDFVDCRS